MIVKHELKANLKTFLIWTITIAGMDFGFMLMYPGLRKSMAQAMEAYSGMGALTTAFGMDQLSMAEPLGFYGIYVGAILALGGALFAAMIGSGLLSKEEGGHTSEFLFTLPYSRVNIILQKIAAALIIILAFDLINLLLGMLSFVLIDTELALKEILLFHLAQFIMHSEIAAVSILLSSFTKKINNGFGLGIAILFYFLDMMSRVLKQLKFAKYITPYYYANAADVIGHHSIEQPLIWIGVGIMIICLVTGIWYYNERDLAS
jgi:hypothetical protein